jgi:hypothetical protein
MIKIFSINLLFVGLISCGPADNKGSDMNFEATDSLVGFELNETRITAVELNNELTFMQSGIIDLIYTLFASDTGEVDLNLENTMFEIDLNINRLNELKSEKGAEEFANAMIELMEFYKSELSSEFLDIVPILKKAEYSEADEKKLDAYDLRFVSEEKAAFDIVVLAQEAFAKNNNISLAAQ